ncbi:methionine/alanine import family NSS transporter small subunit [Jiangella sp. DSM 45060]|nr:methionine/alanine import family NSS transporter small subunit [Jiangella sp. DSM 45060]SDR97038.1 Putative methionine and alanine importer, small subunit [Jiangella sp. DSM 45060]
MSAGAVVMLIVAIVIVWGGLLASLVHLRRHPDVGPPETD